MGWSVTGGERACGKPAHGTHHAAAGQYPLTAPLALYHHTRDHATFDDQLQGFAAQPQLRAMGEGAGGQAGDQGVAGGKPGATRVLQAVPRVTRHQLQAVPQ
ncbi:hypothetical protein D3C77_566950 [compost metagenome]